MKLNEIKLVLEGIVEQLDELEFEFYDAKNSEDFKDVKEGAIIALDEIEEIVERDEALRDVMRVKDEN